MLCKLMSILVCPDRPQGVAWSISRRSPIARTHQTPPTLIFRQYVPVYSYGNGTRGGSTALNLTLYLIDPACALREQRSYASGTGASTLRTMLPLNSLTLRHEG